MNCCKINLGSMASSPAWLAEKSGRHMYSFVVQGKWTTAMPDFGVTLSSVMIFTESVEWEGTSLPNRSPSLGSQ